MSSTTKTSKPTFGVPTAETISAPSRQKTAPGALQTYNFTSEVSSKNQQEKLADITASNEDVIEDSEFLLQASLFLQTAEQQLNKIESSLKRSKRPRKTFRLKIENREKRECAHNKVVEAVLTGHDLNQEEIFTVPTRLQKKLFLKEGESITWNREQQAVKRIYDNCHIKEKHRSSRKKAVNAMEKLNFFIESNEQKSYLPCGGFEPPSQVHENSWAERILPSENVVKKKFEGSPVTDETSIKYKESGLCGAVKKKSRIQNIHVSESDKNERHKNPAFTKISSNVANKNTALIKVISNFASKNAALINVVSNVATSEEENKNDTCAESKIKKSLVIQALPSINIKPELTQETFTQVNILPSKNLRKEFAVKKNVAFIEIVFDEKYSEKESKSYKSPTRYKHKHTEPMKIKSSLSFEKVLQIGEVSDSLSTECATNSETNLNYKNKALTIKKQEKKFERGKLDDVLNAITEKLASHVEIPDEILENAIKRLWVLGDYLEDVYVNSVEKHQQKVRLNFTSLWLHEIVRLIDKEMKQRCKSLCVSSGIGTIVQYIISEIQCVDAVSKRQSCIIAEENGEINFYCHHDSLDERLGKSRKENRASMFLKSLNARKLLSDGFGSSLSNSIENHVSHPPTLSIIRERNHSNIENSEHNLATQMPLLSNENINSISTNAYKFIADQRSLKDRDTLKNPAVSNLLPEKLASIQVKSKNCKKEKSASREALNFYDKNKFMNADQRDKVIKKLDEEVQKMLNWREQLRLPDDADHSSMSKTEIPDTKISLEKLSSELPTSSKTKVNTVVRGKNIQNNDIKAAFQESQRIDYSEPDIPPYIVKSIQKEAVSSTNSSEDAVYEDDWEEDCNASTKDHIKQPPSDEANKESSKSLHPEAVIPISESITNNEDEPRSRESGSTIFASNEHTRVSSSNESLSIPKTSNILEKESLKSASSGKYEDRSPHSDLLKPRMSENHVERPLEPCDNLLEGKHPGKNATDNSATGSDTNISSEFSGQKSNSVNTVSDNAQNSNSNFKKSCVDSEAETVKDLSLLNSEVVDTDSKITLNLLIQENSFKENDSKNIKQCVVVSSTSECDSMFSDASSEMNESEITDQAVFNRGSNKKSKKPAGSKTPKTRSNSLTRNTSNENSAVSLKLSRSCHELAEKVLRIEQMKNDLLKVLIKSENESLNKNSSIDSLCGTIRKQEKSEKPIKYEEKAPSCTTVPQINDMRNANLSVSHSGTDTNNFKHINDEDRNSPKTIFLETKCEKSNESDIVCHESKVNEENVSLYIDPAKENANTIKSAFNEALSGSSGSSSNSEIRIKSSGEVVPESNNFQLGTENVFSESKQISNKNCSPSHKINVKTKENIAVKSFVQLSNEILNHLKEEGEILAQLDSATWSHKTISEGSVSTNEATSSEKSFSARRNCEWKHENSSSQSELGSDGIDVPPLSTDVSTADFEHIMSELSENIMESVYNNSDDVSGDSIDEIFSIISSERYKVDSSRNIDSSIQDILCSANVNKDYFVFEHF